MTKPVISIVGRSNSGKTTLLEMLIPELKKRGYRVAVIKHDVHGFNIDKEGKDSWRMSRAGVDEVIISSPSKLALIKNVPKEMTIDEIAGRYLFDVDIVLTEGFKRENKPKIEVFTGQGQDLLCESQELIAVVSRDGAAPFEPTFRFEDVHMLVDLIEAYLSENQTGRR